MSDERKIVGYDIMTGEPIYEEAQQEAPVVQPEPAAEQPAQGEFVGYDPMTGQPIYGQSQQTEQAPTGFDPMTGQPIYGNMPSAAPVAPKKKKGKVPMAVLAVLAGVIVLALIVVVGVKSGLFLSKGNKVAVATANTFADTPQLVQDLKPLFAVTSGTFSIEGMIKADDIDVNGKVSVDKTELGVQGTLNIEDIPEIDVAAKLAPDGIKVQSKAISDYVFVYKAADDKEDSFLAEMAGEESLEMVDDALIALGETKKPDAFTKEIKELIAAEYSELEFEDAKEKKFEINDKDVKCKGYSVEITEDNVSNVLDGMEDIIDEYYGDMLKDAGMSAKEIVKEIEYELDDMEDLELTFYIYKNQLAALIMEVDGDKLEIEFQGGDYRAQNIVVSAGHNELFEIKGEKKGSVEKVKMLSYDREVIAYEYDTKSGDLVVELDEGYWEIEANVKAKGSSVTVTLEDIYTEDSWMRDMYSLSDIECSFTFSDSAKMPSFSGSEFNIGTAEEDDFYDLVDELEDELEDFEDLYYYF